MRRLPLWLLLLATTVVLAGCGPNLIDLLQNIWTLGFCGTVIVVLDILALIELANSSRGFSSKALWALLIIFFPVGGLILYYFFGR
ncbi:PLD nuclease N-terminal domain-containing protein [Rhodothermus profundi]|uniref:Phospholipase_D-nuclease N-terminal n=1 Tax=Rhodothermus profundi TaxID=633813 RepID=A0A1M6QNY9_9BACT|nr:PLD nuclease N-terminal domain-containing protein [Rhodothermus profundi]SHK21981.1 Phospholipase_D-nuclease N-terminal [Rhodothermus profundi]